MKKRLAYTFILLACTFLSLEAGEKAKGEYEYTRFTFGAECLFLVRLALQFLLIGRL